MQSPSENGFGAQRTFYSAVESSLQKENKTDAFNGDGSRLPASSLDSWAGVS